MNLDLQEPIATVRSVAHTAAEKATDLAPSVDLDRTAKVAKRAARRAAKRAEHASRTAARRTERQVKGQVQDLRDATRRRGSTGGTVLAIVALAAGLGVALWLIRRRSAAGVPEVAPDPFGTGVAATEGPAVRREPAAR